MKRFALLFFVTLQVLSGCAQTSDKEEIVISERLFIAQTNDIYINPREYLGKTIRYEGMFKSVHWSETGQTFHYVFRYGPGCCAYDGEAGFEIAWTGALPQENDWCEAVGTLEMYEDKGSLFLRLTLTSLKILETRGAEYVST